MSDEEFAARLVHGFNRLLQAAVRCYARPAGGGAAGSSPDERAALQELIREYGRVASDLSGALRTWQRGRRPASGAGPHSALPFPAPERLETPPAPAEATPRLRFVRWLYRQGYISG